MKHKKPSISKNYFKLFLSLSLLFILIIGAIGIFTKISDFNDDVEALENNFIENEKEKIKRNVFIASTFIAYQNSTAEAQIKQELRQLVTQAHNIVSNIYNGNKNYLNKTAIQKLITTAIEPIRSENKKQYVFILNMKGDIVFYPKESKLRKLIGKNIYNLKDREGNYVVQNEIKKMMQQDTAFIRYPIPGKQPINPNSKIKISFIKKFKPYNWYMGSFSFVSDLKDRLQAQTLEKLKPILQGKNLAIYNNKRVCLYNSEDSLLIGKNYTCCKKNYVSECLDKLTQNTHIETRFYSHIHLDSTTQIGYTTLFKDWGWIINSHFNKNDIQPKISNKKSKLEKDILFQILQIIFILFIATITFLGIARFISYRMHNSFRQFKIFLTKASYKNVRIDAEKQYFSEFQDLALVVNEMVNTRNLTEEELQEALTKAKEADKLKSSFLANMSHEIKTPMNAIIAFSEILKDDSLSCESRQEILGHIKSSGDSLLQLINDIIDKSIIDAGKLKITKIDFSINSLFDKLENAFNQTKKQSNKGNLTLNFTKGLSDEDAFIYTDPLRLKQILNNLIVNAIKFTPEDGSITITYQKKDNAFIFSITDTGIGIPIHLQEVVFDRFRQADESHTRKFGGTGLGLAISKQLAQLLGGEIWVNSSPKKGSTFSFFIPCTEKKEETKDLLQLVTNSYTTPDLNDKKILIIDNNKTNSLQLIQILNNTHAIIDETDNLKQAITLCQENNYNFVFFNLKLRKTRNYNMLMKRCNTMLIAVMEQDSTIQTQEILDLGFNGYIETPIIGNRVIQLIETTQ